MNDEELIWEELSREHIIQDEWIDFRRSSYRYPDGRVFSPYYSYSRRDYTVIVASDAEGRYLCVRQFRQGIKEVTTEFPAGGIERTDGREYGNSSAAEDALECAKRELLEETGFAGGEWKEWMTLSPNPATSTNLAHSFLAVGVEKVSGQHLDATEDIDVYLLDQNYVRGLLENNQILQALMAAPLWKYFYDKDQ